jgi:hypothetical protein
MIDFKTIRAINDSISFLFEQIEIAEGKIKAGNEIINSGMFNKFKCECTKVRIFEYTGQIEGWQNQIVENLNKLKA